MELDIINYCSFVPYDQGLIKQDKIVELKVKGLKKDFLLLMEHPPVFTLGKLKSCHNLLLTREQLKKKSIQFHRTSRGGDITYHGPGQLVAYPIINIAHISMNIRSYIYSLEDVLIKVLANHSITAQRKEGMPGVWVEDKKIAAIGIAVRKWIVYHGFALNINPSLEHYSYIIPCGIQGYKVTSMLELLGKDCPPIEDVKKQLVLNFMNSFGYTVNSHHDLD